MKSPGRQWRPGRFVRRLHLFLLNLGNNLLEEFRLRFGDPRKRLAIKADVAIFKACHKRAVGRVIGAQAGVEADVP
mgnify:CR=1 FL=1